MQFVRQRLDHLLGAIVIEKLLELTHDVDTDQADAGFVLQHPPSLLLPLGEIAQRHQRVDRRVLHRHVAVLGGNAGQRHYPEFVESQIDLAVEGGDVVRWQPAPFAAIFAIEREADNAEAAVADQSLDYRVPGLPGFVNKPDFFYQILTCIKSLPAVFA